MGSVFHEDEFSAEEFQDLFLESLFEVNEEWNVKIYTAKDPDFDYELQEEDEIEEQIKKASQKIKNIFDLEESYDSDEESKEDKIVTCNPVNVSKLKDICRNIKT